MAVPFLAMAGLGLLSSIYQNKAIEEASSANYANAVERAEREAMAQRGQLMQQSRENSIAVNQERYNLQREAMRERGSEAVDQAERGFSGVLAQRIKTATNLQEAQQDATIDINEELEQSALNARSTGVAQGKVDRIDNARMARHNALAQRKQGVGLVVDTVSAGATGMQMASSLGIGGNTTVNTVDTKQNSFGVLRSDVN